MPLTAVMWFAPRQRVIGFKMCIRDSTNLTWNAKTGYWMTTNTTANAVYVSPNGAVNNYEHKLLAADFNLTLTETQDKWGRPTHTWNKGTATIGE